MSFDNDYTKPEGGEGQEPEQQKIQDEQNSAEQQAASDSTQPPEQPSSSYTGFTGFGSGTNFSSQSTGANSQGSNSYGQSGYNQPYGNYGQTSNGYGQTGGYGPYQSNPGSTGSQYGGNMQYKWNYDDYQKALQKDRESKPKKKKGVRAAIISVSAVFGIAVIGLAVIGGMNLANGSLPIAGATSQSTSSSGRKAGAPSIAIAEKPTASSSSQVAGSALSTSDIYKKVSPSVVGILAYNLSSVSESAQGTGIIMSKDGYIITNEHVIDGANKVAVVLPGGTSDSAIDAVVVGKDTRNDLAVLKINAKTTLTPATFGDSKQLQVGETVIAIGNPGGLEFADTLTQGVVSAVNRPITTESGYTQNCIQTDASINPGNSGGPLVNVYGQVVGITSSKISETGFEGMGFAIPIGTAKPVIDDLISYGYVKGRVKLGISVTEFSDYQAKIYNMQPGLLVSAVDPSSDAAKQGLKAYDIITKINGIAATSYDAFYAEESKHKPGDTVTLSVYRYANGKSSTFDIKVTLAEDKGDTSATTSSSSSSADPFGYGNGYGYGNGNGSDSGSNNDPFGFFNGNN